MGLPGEQKDCCWKVEQTHKLQSSSAFQTRYSVIKIKIKVTFEKESSTIHIQCQSSDTDFIKQLNALDRMINASLIYTNQNVIGSKQDIHANPICLLRNVAAAAGTSNASAFGLLFGYVRASCMHYGDPHSNNPHLSLLAFPAYFSMVNQIYLERHHLICSGLIN